MKNIRNVVCFLGKLLAGNDPLIIVQDTNQWDLQFEKGAWERLMSNQPNTEYIAEYILSRVAVGSTLRVLDVGCGNGGLARILAPAHKGIEYVGTDISTVALRQASQNSPWATFLVADAVTPPPTVGEFDVIVFNEILYYTNPVIAIRTHTPYLRTEGTFVISIIRSWRSPFIWRRIKSLLTVNSKIEITSRKGTQIVWDVVIGRVTRSSS